ncbi:trypco2 family protein [Streptomyces collinus]|uniref:Trypsin-co-occurring domain-containing protein n=1 Tax=Streptomyces collinus TaxID=42684 RepID=A0AA89Q8Q0_STRCU|nr:trypco2 family protein [Streptomyces collinus]MBB5816331.1 hypothetical protein [Streptomyces collinus]WMX69149.1 trypco2 family protein [Streptomyces collinus]
MAEIGLAAAIEELRQELYRAQESGVRQQFAFEVEEAQLELLLELRSDVRPEGKVSFGVASVGVNGTSASARTHKLVLKLKVRDQALGEGPEGPRNALVNNPVAKDW